MRGGIPLAYAGGKRAAAVASDVARERGGLEVPAPPRFGLHRFELTALRALADLPRGASEQPRSVLRAEQRLGARWGWWEGSGGEDGVPPPLFHGGRDRRETGVGPLGDESAAQLG
jgi:hypothetical protein